MTPPKKKKTNNNNNSVCESYKGLFWKKWGQSRPISVYKKAEIAIFRQ
jgi:hypothetical protein